MPECMLMACADELPRLRAEQLRDASYVAAFPHMGKNGARDWLRTLTKAATRAVSRMPVFSWNGRPIKTSDLRRKFGELLGGGYAND